MLAYHWSDCYSFIHSCKVVTRSWYIFVSLFPWTPFSVLYSYEMPTYLDMFLFSCKASIHMPRIGYQDGSDQSEWYTVERLLRKYAALYGIKIYVYASLSYFFLFSPYVCSNLQAAMQICDMHIYLYSGSIKLCLTENIYIFTTFHRIHYTFSHKLFSWNLKTPSIYHVREPFIFQLLHLQVRKIHWLTSFAFDMIWV
jgi:hypothetical protein